MPIVAKPGEPVAQIIHFGWVLMSPGKEAEPAKLMCTETSMYAYLCRKGVLGVAGTVCDDNAVHQDIKDQLRRSKDGCYETGLIWKDNSTSLQNSKFGSLGRLKNLVQNFQRVFESYDQFLQ